MARQGFWLLFLACACAGCMGPRPIHEGPDVVRVPAGFIYDGNVQAARNLFPECPKVLERGYTTAAIADDDHSSIHITEYAGPTTGEQVAEAVRADEERYGHAEYGALEPLTIDERPAWGWTETQRGRGGKVAAIQYRAVVSYDEVTYLVEFYTTHQRFMDPAQLEDVVTSFVLND